MDKNNTKYGLLGIGLLIILLITYPFITRLSSPLGLFLYYLCFYLPLYLSAGMKNQWGTFVIGITSLVVLTIVIEGLLPGFPVNSLADKYAIYLYLAMIVQVIMAGWISYNKNQALSRLEARLNQAYRENALIEQQHMQTQSRVQELQKENLHHISHLHKLTEYLREINKDVSFTGVLKNSSIILKEHLSPSYYSIYRVHYPESAINLVSEEGESQSGEVAGQIKFGEGFIGKVAESRQAFMYPSVSQQRDDITQKNRGDIRVAYPLMFQMKLLGVLYLELPQGKYEQEKLLLETLVTFISMAMNSAELMEQKQQEAITDGLTQLLNHANYEQRLKETYASARRYQRPLSILLFDVDNFKHYNDTNGHQQGDIVLMDVARILKTNTRASDIVARYGGEEFVAILPETNLKGAEVAAEKIRKAIESHSFPNGEKQPLGKVTISCGVSSLSEEITSPEQLVEMADQALYRAKEKGRNRVEIAY